jgi:hypothetical protein
MYLRPFGYADDSGILHSRWLLPPDWIVVRYTNGALRSLQVGVHLLRTSSNWMRIGYTMNEKTNLILYAMYCNDSDRRLRKLKSVEKRTKIIIWLLIS